MCEFVPESPRSFVPENMWLCSCFGLWCSSSISLLSQEHVQTRLVVHASAARSDRDSPPSLRCFGAVCLLPMTTNEHRCE